MVLRKQHKVLDIDEANYGNVGYNGSWAATYGIADPRQLQRMQPDGAPAQGVQRYRQARGESQVLIDWDIQGSTRAGSRSRVRTASRSARSR